MSVPTPPELDATVADRSGAATLGDTSVAGDALLAGRYRLLGLLGVGGMGAVYRARDTQLDEAVALKMLRGEAGAPPAALRRFRDEVKLARKVTHRNVARTFDIGAHEGALFLTMELLEGESLAARIEREGPLPLAATIDVAIDIARGLEAAHAAGVVHRDLKPANVFLSADGRAVVTDFGIALAPAVENDERRDELVGTPAYAAPEQVDGSGDVDARADLYALGEVIYEMLTGEQPWPASTPARTMMMRLVAPPPDASKLRSDVPPALVALLPRLLARQREQRCSTAQEVRAVLESARGDAAAAPAAAPRAVVLPPAILRADRSVAVLPLRSDGVPDYVAAGLLEDLVDTVAMTRGLQVRPIGMVAPYAATRGPSLEIGRALGVQVVVEGSLRAVAGGLRLSLRAVSVDNGFQFWAERWERPADQSLLLADTAATAIAHALTSELAPPARGAHVPGGAEAYLRARAAFRSSYFSQTELPAVVELFETAVALTPDDPRVLAGAALAHARTASWGLESGRSAPGRARAQLLADRAIALAPQLGEPWLAVATLRRDALELVPAVGALRAALQAEPRHARAREMLGAIALEAGQIDAAIVLLRSAIALDASSVAPRFDLARAHVLRGEPRLAAEVLEAGLRDDEPRFARDWVRARLAGWTQDDALRRAVARDAASADPARPRIVAVLQRFALSTDLPAEDREFLEERSRTSTRRLRLINAQVIAELDAALGVANPLVMARVQAVVDAGLRDLAWLDHCPLLAPLRSMPGWSALRAPIAAEAAEIAAALRA